MEPPVASRPAAPARRRPFGEILEELIDDCAMVGTGPGALDTALDAVVAALDAAGVRLLDSRGEVVASSGDALGTGAVLDATTPDGGRLEVGFDGPETVTARQLSLVAQLVGLVLNVTDARRQADTRFESQRQAWGQEIHDGVTQSVTAAILALERVRGAVAGTSADALLGATQDHVRQSLAELREVLACVVDDTGRLVAPTASETLLEVVDDVRTRWRLQARVTVAGDLDGVGSDIGSTVRAVVREALVNVAKHAEARRVTVSVSTDAASVRVAVVDDGIGVRRPDEERPPGVGMGLRLLDQRVAMVGGTLTVGPGSPTGTEVLAVLPLSPA